MPKVSVVMSAYNEEQNISSAIESILCQTFADFEFVIVNDGSTDKTIDVIKSFNDKRIRIIENRENQGLTECLNKGVQCSNGNFIARMDADDISHPTRLANQLAFMQCNPNVAVAGSWAYVIDKDSGSRRECKPPVHHHDITMTIQKDNPFVHSSLLFRREAGDLVGWYSLNGPAQDYDLLIRIAERFEVANLPTFLVTRYEDRNLRKKTYQGFTRYDMSCTCS